MKTLLKILLATGIILAILPLLAYAAPTYRLERSIMPETTNTYELGTSTLQWLRGTFQNLCLAGDCRSVWPGGSGGIENIWKMLNGNAVTTTTVPVKIDGRLYASSSALVNGTTTIGSPTNYFDLGIFYGSGVSAPIIKAVSAAGDFTGVLNNSWYVKEDRALNSNPVFGLISDDLTTQALFTFSTTSGSLTTSADNINLNATNLITLASGGTTTANQGVDISSGCFAQGGVCITSLFTDPNWTLSGGTLSPTSTNVGIKSGAGFYAFQYGLPGYAYGNLGATSSMVTLYDEVGHNFFVLGPNLTQFDNPLVLASTTATSTGANGWNLSGGCYALNSICLPTVDTSFSTTSANYWISLFNKGYFFSTTSADHWLTTKSTSDLAEGTNLYWTNTRFDARLSATTSLPNINTLASLSLPTSQLSGILAPNKGGTGITAVPTYGLILVGNNSGDYTLTATSGLGINSSQWVNVSGGINYPDGNVGVGKTPSTKLDVDGTASSTNLYVNSKIGIASTSPTASLSINPTLGTSPLIIASSSISSAPSIYVDGNTGNVGFGTSTPPSRLTFASVGTGNFQVGAMNDLGANYTAFSLNGVNLGSTTYNFASSPSDQSQTLFINRPLGGSIRFREGNGNFNLTRQDQMTLLTNGNIGIGTSTPSNFLTLATTTDSDNSLVLLETKNVTMGQVPKGCIEFSTPISTLTNQAFDAGRLCAGFVVPGSGYSRSGIYFQYPTAENTWTDGLILRGTGFVGIGTTTPEDKLVIEKTGNANNYRMLRLQNYDTGNAAVSGMEINAGANTNGGLIYYRGSGYSTDPNSFWFNNVQNAPIIFANNNAEKARFDVGGNFGIASTSPFSLLSVGGDTWLDNPSSATTRLRMESSEVLRNDGATQYLGNVSGTSLPTVIRAGGADRIYASNSAVLVGIGTTTPARTLTVWKSGTRGELFLADGSATVDTTTKGGTYLSSDDGLFNIQGMDSQGSGSGTFFTVDQVNGRVGVSSSTPFKTFSVTGTVAFSPGSITTNTGASTYSLCLGTSGEMTKNSDAETCIASSERFKKNIESLGAGLDEVLKLRPVTFEMKDTSNKGKKLGFIAEEAQKVDPRLVSLDEQGLPNGIHWSFITTLNTKAIQELGSTVYRLIPILKNHNDRISKLEKENAELKARLLKLESKLK